MRIAYLFDRPLPATETDSEQAIQTLCALSRRGHEIVLCVPRRGASADAAAIREYYQVEGAFELRVLDNALAFWSTGRKWLHAARALDLARTLAPDLIYTRNFPTLARLPGVGLPYAYETYRPWFTQYPPLRPAFARALRHPSCLGAVLHSHYARDHFARLGLPDEKLLVAHNGYDPRRFEGAPDKLTLRRELCLPIDAKVATYAGHVNATKGLDIVLSAAARLPELRFLLVGSSGHGLVERLARAHANVTLVPWQPFDRTVHYLLASDVLIQPPSRVPLAVVGNTVLPMKLFLYLAAGRPILAPDTPDVRELLRHDHNALLVTPGDVSATAAALTRLTHDAALAARLGENAGATAQGLTWDARAAEIERFLQHRLERQRAEASAR